MLSSSPTPGFSPFTFFEQIARQAGEKLQPPQWLIAEFRNRAVLTLNHILQQEPEALARLTRQKGRVVRAQWRTFTVELLITPAGLLDVAPAGASPDLTLSLTEDSPAGLARSLARGEKPPVRIEGDVQLAAEINWLVDNVRWDVEDDLARVIGDVPAHHASRVARMVADALKRFVSLRSPNAAPAAATARER